MNVKERRRGGHANDDSLGDSFGSLVEEASYGFRGRHTRSLAIKKSVLKAILYDLRRRSTMNTLNKEEILHELG